MAKRYVATERDAMELRRIVRKVDTISGDGVTNRREQITIAAPRPRTQRRAGNDSGRHVYATITGDRTCGGVYAGYLLRFTATEFDTSSASFERDDLAETYGDEITLFNFFEIDATSHALTAGTPPDWLFEVKPLPFLDASGRYCYYLTGININCSS